MRLEPCHIVLLLTAFSWLRHGNASLAAAHKSVRKVDAVIDTGAGVTLYQTRPFCFLLGALLVIVLWMAYRLRLEAVTERERHQLAERLLERERISHELSDTLLQGMQGLILLFQGIAVQIPSETPLASRLEAAINSAQRSIVEGRDSIRDHRAPNFNLPEALRSLHAEQRPLGTEFSIDVNGRERELQLLIADEIFKIAHDAIVEALHHASADHVWVTLTYRRTSLVLDVVDDGRTVRSDVSEDSASGRWGIAGMNGRARKLEGKLLIANRSPTGTEVRLTVPAGVAYPANVFFFREWLQRLTHFFPRREPRR